jgi:hypothetical protein
MNATVPRDAAGGDDIDLVAKVALDSAEVANRSARAAAHTASKLAEVTAHFDQALGRQRRQMILIVSVSGLVALLAFAMFIASAIQLRGRVVQVNAMLQVMATRSIELRQGLEQIGPLAERVEGFAGEVAAMSRAQRELQSSVQRLDKTLAARPAAPVTVLASPQPAAPVPPPPAPAPPPPRPAVAPAETAEQIAARERLMRQTLDSIQAVAAQSKALEASLRSQSGVLTALGNRVSAIEQSVAALPVMQSDLKLILRNDQTRAAAVERVAAERKREEVLRDERERFVQFPRQDGSTQGGGQPGGRPDGALAPGK